MMHQRADHRGTVGYMYCICGSIWPCAGGVPNRHMVLADIVPPFVWAYTGHVLPNGEAYRALGTPVWCSNAPEWHGL